MGTMAWIELIKHYLHERKVQEAVVGMCAHVRVAMLLVLVGASAVETVNAFATENAFSVATHWAMHEALTHYILFYSGQDPKTSETRCCCRIV